MPLILLGHVFVSTGLARLPSYAAKDSYQAETMAATVDAVMSEEIFAIDQL